MKKLLIAALLLVSVLNIQAQQRYGHLNFSALLAAMPESSEAESQLQALQEQLTAQGEEKMNTLNTAFQAYRSAEQTGDKSPNELRVMAEALQRQQAELQTFEQQAAQDLERMRADLLEPIVVRAQQAVEDVARENNYLMVFDTGVFNAILFAKDAEDLMPLVKTKLGLDE